ncbi:MAG TPA: hypothetical protein VMZ27_09540 [Candidatus Saccharimonadales bacterium]|nr:hypothetical protein [Candidatus Saccharimonadales bacterium]
MWLQKQYGRLFDEEKEFSGKIVLWLVCLAFLGACFMQVDIDELYYRSLPVPQAPPPPTDPKELAELNHLHKLEEQYFKFVKNPVRNRRSEELGRKIYDTAFHNPSALTDFAWRIMAEKGIRRRDLQLAERAAQRASELSRGRSIWVTTAYARALFENGKLEEAIIYQQQALDSAETNQVRGECEATLNKYKRILRERSRSAAQVAT